MSGEPARVVRSTTQPPASRVWLVCPSCESETDLIRDGVCIYCHYTLCGGDLASDDALNGAWEARLAHV